MSEEIRRKSPDSVSSLMDALVGQHADRMIELARDVRKSYLEIAKEIFPDVNVDAERNRFRLAVSRALKVLIPEELPDLTKQRRVLTGQKNVSVNPKENLDKLRRGRKIRLESMKFVDWKKGEKDLVIALAENPNFHTYTRLDGKKPDFVRIAEFINASFHRGNPIRSHVLLSNIVSRHRSKEKEQGAQ